MGRIYSLDFDFLHQVRDFADTLRGIEKDRYAFTNRPSDYGDDGRYRLTIYPTQNKAGIEAKAVLFNRFFSPDGSRKDISKDAEKGMILSSIEKSKTEKTYIQESKTMGKLNFANINAGLNSVKTITENLDNLSHSENVSADTIHPAVNNPYSQDDSPESVLELADNIRTNGLIHPIVVNKITTDNYQLISGERRFKAITQHLHWRTIPCMVYDHISSNSAALKLHAANLEVRDYTTEQKLRFYEETNKLLHSMKENGEYTGPIQKGIAELLGVSDRQVRKYKAISENLPEEAKQAVIRGEVSINDACRTIPTEEKSGTGSAFPETSEDSEESTKPEVPKYDSPYWNERILSALKYHYDKNEIYAFYIFQVPTTSEAIKEKLKPAYGYSGGSVKFSDDTWGDLTARSQKMTVTCGIKAVCLTYSQVDEIIRKAIRNGKWLSPKEAKALIIKKFQTE
ncbi:MAG TPA: ParB/RepB/Spo0J family partition protein [Caproicibacter sp.]|nr:ParB/RepB/Spo0J family partition protein [Caproicibacter sp.]